MRSCTVVRPALGQPLDTTPLRPVLSGRDRRAGTNRFPVPVSEGAAVLETWGPGGWADSARRLLERLLDTVRSWVASAGSGRVVRGGLL